MTAPEHRGDHTGPATSDRAPGVDDFALARVVLPSGAECLVVRVGRRDVEHVVPPAGEAFAFDVQRWARRVEISRSPKGRSVRVFVDGREVHAGHDYRCPECTHEWSGDAR